MKSASRLLVLGAGGMMGTALAAAGRRRGYAVTPLTRQDLDITDPDAAKRAIARFAADAATPLAVVINAAAYTDVDGAEDDQEVAFLVNARAPGLLAQAVAAGIGLPSNAAAELAFVHISTDYVFDGTKGGAYTEEDEPRPLNVYGASKLMGEQEVFSRCPGSLVVRTSWVFGKNGVSFPQKILAKARSFGEGGGTLDVVADEIGNPTYASDLAEGLLDLCEAGARGLFHLAGSGHCSRYEQALETLRRADGGRLLGRVAVEPAMSGDFPTRAARPLRTVLDCGRAARLGVELPPWYDGLTRYLEGV